jgi:hypothetical protein
MNSKPVSPRRRQVMLAGAAGIAAPSGVFALAPVSGFLPDETLLVSGRIIDGNGKPIAGAWVAGIRANASDTPARTDGDGRFMLETRVSGAGAYIEYGMADLHSGPSSRVRVSYREAPARFQRDEHGTWRTTFTLQAV